MSDEQTVNLFLKRAVERTRLNRLLASLGNAVSLLALLGLTVLVINLGTWLGESLLAALRARLPLEAQPFNFINTALLAWQNFTGPILPLSGRTILVLFTVGLAASALLLLRAWLRPISPLAVAQEIDTRLKLHDRLSSALEFAQRKQPSNFIQAALLDTAAHVKRLNVVEALPLRIPRSIQATSTFAAYAATVAITLIIALALTSTLSSPITEAKSRIKVDTGDLRKAVQALREEAARQGDRAAEKLTQKIDEVLSQLERGELSKEEALKKLAELQREIQQQQQDPEGLQAAMQQMASAFARSQQSSEVAQELQQQDATGASEKMQELAEEVGNGELNQQQTQSLQDALNAASKAAGSAADQDLQQLSEDLKHSAEQLDQGNSQAAKQQLQQAAEHMKKLADKSASNQRLEQAKQQLENARESVRSAENQQKNNQAQSGQQPAQGQPQAGQGEQAQGNQPQPGNQPGANQEGQEGQNGSGQGDNQNQQGDSNAQGQGLSAGAQEGDKKLVDPTKRDAAKQKAEIEGEANQLPPPSANDKESDLTASTSYRQAVLAADKAAQEVINRDDIPPSYRRIVKKYFNSIKPKN